MIESYTFGRMVVDGVAYTSDLLVLHDRVIDDWWRRGGHQLWPDDLEAVMATDLRHLIVGTGAQGMMVVVEETKRLLAERSIALTVETTDRAWRTFNAVQGPRVVGAFHLTC